MQFPATRQGALQRLEEFLDEAPRYAARRNYVLPGHPQVSRLSAAIRRRLITESEVVEATLRRYPFRAVEKFLQEVLWRSYWKGWLEMRPQMWRSYAAAVRGAKSSEDARAVVEGRSRSGIMNHFARELLETGYMHNHARMWWTSYWIHHCRLPWEFGADHFFRHLLDADPASNTLSWRWVAGLQTRGKTYLATAQN
ncbi:MAG: FAD-binding domain-containing protein, partial [Chthoniobacterales bacterium]